MRFCLDHAGLNTEDLDWVAHAFSYGPCRQEYLDTDEPYLHRQFNKSEAWKSMTIQHSKEYVRVYIRRQNRMVLELSRWRGLQRWQSTYRQHEPSVDQFTFKNREYG